VPDSASERALTDLGFRPPTLDQLGAPRSAFERIGAPGADSSPAEIILGVVFLAVLVYAWALIVISDMNIALRVLCALAIVGDLVMILARVRYLLERRGTS
jgi:DMSO reductase anchor subunit